MVRIPRRLDEILPAAAMEKVLDVLQQPDISNKVREAMSRVGLRETTPLDKVKDAWQQARSWLDSIAGEATAGQEQPTTLNASGQLLRADLAGMPMAPSIAYGYAKAATNFQKLSQLEQKTSLATASIFPGSTTVWLQTTGEALRLLAAGDAAAEGVVISRADAVRIPKLGDVRAMLAGAGHALVEIGAANGASAEDWQAGLTSARQTLVLCSPNNLSAEQAGQHRSDALQAAQACGARVVELLADGVLSQGLTEGFGFPDVRQRLASGAHVVVLPLQFLLGGPTGALVVGNDSDQLNRLRRAAEATGSLLNGPALVAATMALQIASLSDDLELGVAAQLLANSENLKNRARRIAVQLTGVAEVAAALETEHRVDLGPTPWNRYQLTSWGVRLQPKNSLDALIKQIREESGKQGIALEYVSEPNGVLLDLRFIPPESDHELVRALAGSDIAAAQS